MRLEGSSVILGSQWSGSVVMDDSVMVGGGKGLEVARSRRWPGEGGVQEKEVCRRVSAAVLSPPRRQGDD